MKKGIEINTISAAVGMYLFLAYFYTFLSYFSWNVPLVLLFTLLILLLVSRCYGAFYFRKFTFIMLFWLFVFLLSVKNNGYLEIGRYTNFFMYLLAVAMAYMLQYSVSWYRYYAKWTVIFSLVHFITAWFFLLCPPVYEALILPVFGSAKRGRMMGYVRNHILMGLSDHYSTSGIYFAFAVLVFWALLLTGRRKFLWLTATLAMYGSLLMTQKRGPLLYVTFIMLATYAVWHRIRFETVVKLLGFSVLGLVLLLVAVQVFPDLGNVFRRFVDEAGDMTNGRDIIYDFAKEMFRTKPVFGIGWGQFSIQYAKRFYNGNYKLKMEAHNIYLQLLTEMGVVGAVLVYLVFAWALFSNLALIRKHVRHQGGKPDDGYQGFALLFALCMQMFFLLYGITENPLYDNQCQMMYFLSVAVVCSQKINMEAQTERRES